ncbi:transposase [Streptomyces sp. NPDC017260]|uniref:transposase n=1 Tax=unclassified Streptomyces TaxID=2593676 RepID=UPI0037AAC94D
MEAARTACHEMTALADLIHRFAVLLDPGDGNAALLSTWITSAQAEDLPHLRAFTRGLEKDRAAVDAAFTLPHHNGGTEGVNNKTKVIKRQMYGRASFPPPAPPHPPGLTAPSVTTDYGTDPNDLLSPSPSGACWPGQPAGQRGPSRCPLTSRTGQALGVTPVFSADRRKPPGGIPT